MIDTNIERIRTEHCTELKVMALSENDHDALLWINSNPGRTARHSFKLVFSEDRRSPWSAHVHGG